MPLVGSGNSFGGISGSNAAARLLVVISGTSAPLTAAIAQANGTLAGFQKNAGQLGSALTRSLTLPLLAIGGASIALASRFENLLARIAGLTPITAQFENGIEGVRQELLAIANDPQVVAAPEALAESLYFAGSAGLDAGDALDIVKLSAQGASIGMGEAADISKVLIFALNNYPELLGNAGAAMDTLTAAIREGTSAPDELAIALGRLLPIAAKAGVSFEQVVGSVSALTNLGVPTRVATTSLRALFSQLLAPTIQAKELLDSLGLSAEQLRERLELGPIAAFQLLEKATAGNVDQMHDLIPQIRAITALYGLSGDKAERYKDILLATNNAQGKFQAALDEISKTPGFQFQKSLQELQIAGIELGAKLFPVFRGIAEVISRVASAFDALPGPIQAAAAAALTLGAAAGPVIKLYAALTATRTISLGLMQATVPTFGAMATSLGLAAVAAGIAAGAFSDMQSQGASLANTAIALVGTFVAVRFGLFGIQQALSAIKLTATKDFLQPFLQLSPGKLAGIAGGITAIVGVIALLVAQSNQLDNAVAAFGDGLVQAGSAGETFKQVFEGLEDNGLAERLTAIAQSLGLLNQQITDINLEQFREGIGTDIADELQQLTRLDTQGLGQGLDGLASRFRAAAIAGQDLDDAGISVTDTLAQLETIQSQATGGDAEQVIQVTEALGQLILEYNEAGSARERLNDITTAAIAGHTQEEEALSRLATNGGASMDFTQGKLEELGLTASEVGPDMEDSFFEASFGLDKFGNAVDGAAAEAKAAIQEMAVNMAENLSETVGLFDELPEKIKESAAELANHAGQMSRLAVQQTQDVLALARRGVPAGLLDELIAGGPALLSKFASASDTELRKLVTAYEIRLAAMDAAILQEAQHQEVKGKGMVEGFALAILGSRAIAGSAANGIIQTVGNAFAKGNLSAQGVRLATNFIHGLGRAKGLSQQEGTKVARAFASSLTSGKFIDNAGNVLVNKLATAISSKAPIAKAQAVKLVQEAAQGVEQGGGQVLTKAEILSRKAAIALGANKSQAFAQGSSLSNQFAAGISAGGGAAVAAAQAVAAQVKDAMTTSLQSSPEFFTYYLGRQLVKDMDRGVKDEEGLRGYRPFVTMPPMDRSGPNQGVERLARAIRDLGDRDIVLKVDGREIARANERYGRKVRA